MQELESLTIATLIDKLQELAAVHGGNTFVYLIDNGDCYPVNDVRYDDQTCNCDDEDCNWNDLTLEQREELGDLKVGVYVSSWQLYELRGGVN